MFRKEVAGAAHVCERRCPVAAACRARCSSASACPLETALGERQGSFGSYGMRAGDG
jgi:hypothetical protein